MHKLYIILFCLATMQVSAQAPLVFDDFDLNPDTIGHGFSKPYGFTSLNGKFIFMAFKDTAGYELWVSDGTKTGTKFIKDVYPYSNYSNIFYPTEFAGKVYFSASHPTYGRELWMTDGTDTGTQLVKNINIYSANSDPESLTVYNGKLYFTAEDTGHGKEMWVSDGTLNGTQLFIDINTGKAFAWPRGFTEHNGKLYFSADDGTNGRELWVTDGTANGTMMLKDIVPGSGSGWPGAFFTSGTDLYFRATTPATGYELWKTDGTANGTQMITDITGDSTDGIKFQESSLAMINFNSKVYFQGTDTARGTELWETDGTANGTKLVKDIRPNMNANRSGSPGGFTEYKNKLYFSAADTSSNIEVWESDGTTAGTKLFKEFRQGKVYGGAARLFTVYKNHLYFKAQLDTGGWQLIRSDGTVAGTKVVRPPTATVQDNCAEWFTTQLFINPADSAMYFAAEYTATGYELWKLKDTTGSTQPGSVDNINSHSDFTLYPNPNNGTFTLELSKMNFKAASLQVYDITGRLCYHEPINNSKSTIKVNLMSGTYFVKLLVDDEIMTKKVMVE